MMPYDLFIGTKKTKTPAEAGVFSSTAESLAVKPELS
jgi:hypothetical protein